MIDELAQELRSYPAHYVAAHRAADALERIDFYNCRLEDDLFAADLETERLRKHVSKQQLDIATLGQEVGRLREVLTQYSCGCSGPCWYPKDSPSCGLKARTALEEKKEEQ
jgi:hypothetical protein